MNEPLSTANTEGFIHFLWWIRNHQASVALLVSI